jgi:sigma-54 dependent transcriptional regulator, acetoin dehydrogenase operon transcriptional activator AcoR
VRQLHSALQQMVGRAKGDRLTVDLVPEHIRAPRVALSDSTVRAEMLSKERLEEALAEHQGNVRRTAEHLGISRARLYRLMEKHGIMPPR